MFKIYKLKYFGGYLVSRNNKHVKFAVTKCLQLHDSLGVVKDICKTVLTIYNPITQLHQSAAQFVMNNILLCICIGMAPTQNKFTWYLSARILCTIYDVYQPNFHINHNLNLKLFWRFQTACSELISCLRHILTLLFLHWLNIRIF